MPEISVKVRSAVYGAILFSAFIASCGAIYLPNGKGETVKETPPASAGKLTLTPESLAALGPLGTATVFWQCAKCNHDFETEYEVDAHLIACDGDDNPYKFSENDTLDKVIEEGDYSQSDEKERGERRWGPEYENGLDPDYFFVPASRCILRMRICSPFLGHTSGMRRESLCPQRPPRGPFPTAPSSWLAAPLRPLNLHPDLSVGAFSLHDVRHSARLPRGSAVVAAARQARATVVGRQAGALGAKGRGSEGEGSDGMDAARWRRRGRGAERGAVMMVGQSSGESGDAEAGSSGWKTQAAQWTKAKLSAALHQIQEFRKTPDGIAAGGVSALIAYGLVSHLTYSTCIMAAWLLHAGRTGLSPLMPGQWAPFLAVYLGVCAVPFWLRPLRLGAALLLAPWVRRAIAGVRRAIASAERALGSPTQPVLSDAEPGSFGEVGTKRAVGACVTMCNILLPLLYLHLGLRAVTCAFSVPLFNPSSAALGQADVAKYALATVAGQVVAGPLGAIGALMLVDDFSWVRMASILIMG